MSREISREETLTGLSETPEIKQGSEHHRCESHNQEDDRESRG